MRKHGLKVLGLSLMAMLGLMAFAAVGAQAQELPGASSLGLYLINLGNALLATATGAQVGVGKLLVEGRGIEIGCDTAHVVEGKIDSATDALAKLEFLKCKTYEFGTLALIESCVIKGGTVANGGTVLAKALLLPILHGGVNYVLAEPQEGTNFATVSYEPGIGCVLPLNNPVSGSVSAQVHEGVVAKLLLSPAIQLLTGDKLLFGTFPSYIDAEATVELTGSHSGQKLGVH
jgi:hypothetical protein